MIRRPSNSENKQRRRTRHPVHQTDSQRSPPYSVSVGVRVRSVRQRFARMAVEMKVSHAVRVSVTMNMDTIAP